MIHVEIIDLAPRAITLPSDGVGMVISQPFLSLTANEPYKCEPNAKVGQLAVLTATLNVARAVPHGKAKTHFTVFPEYSIPGPEGIMLIQAALERDDWPGGTFIIGGTDALTKAEFSALAESPRTHVSMNHNPLLLVRDDEWINCCITWAKADDGTVERWLQPKLYPAWLEQNVIYQGMFRGGSVFMFKGEFDNNTQYHFSSLVCIDWVYRLGGQPAWRWVLDGLARHVAPGQLSLSWFFVIQCNDKPNHNTFLAEVVGFFDQTTVPNVRRDCACLVFANCAGLPDPGRTTKYGGTSLIFAPQAQFAKPDCYATFSNGGLPFRSSNVLSPYRDVYFREGGACIHSFGQVNPAAINPGAAGRMLPLQNPFVFALNGVAEPRAPGGPVQACTKWLVDELDAVEGLGTIYPATTLAGQANAVHQASIAALRAIPTKSMANAVNLAASESTTKFADAWGRTEVEAVEHFIHTLNIVSLGFPDPKVGADPAHATIQIDNEVVDLLAIRGTTHEACVEHSKKFNLLPRRQYFLVSRDRDNTAWRNKLGSFLETDTSRLGEERKFTNPQGGSLHLGYERLLEIFRNAPTPAYVQGKISGELRA